MRRRFPLLILVVALVSLVFIWSRGETDGQQKVILTLVVSALALISLALWFVIGFPAALKVRVGVSLGAVAALVILGATFRVRGVTGDLVPILEYRFSDRPVLPEAPPPSLPPVSEVEPPARAAEPVPLVTEPEADPSGAPSTVLPVAPEPAATAPDEGWPQFLGPNRSGIVSDPGLAKDWSARPPKLLWRQPVGAGWAGFSSSAGLVITLEQRDAEEWVIAYDLRTGRPVWSHRDAADHDSPLGGPGPRSVPTIDAGQVFTQGATGILNALDLRTGQRQWSRNVLRESGGSEPDWGVAISPLLHGDLVIVSAGGSAGRALMAFSRGTGEVVWAQGRGGLAYSSPTLLTLAGRQQIVMLNKASVAGHDPETGNVLWEQDFPSSQPNVAPPLGLSSNRVLFSTGYGIGSRVFEISDGSGETLEAKLVWSTPRLKSKFANMVLFEGSVYGLDDGVLVCLDPLTGERRWKAGRYGHGQLILAGRNLLVQTERGEVVLIELSPERLIELTRFTALDGKTWNPPALAGSILVVRNDLEAAAYELPTLP